jgi:DnaJ-class molecular chaperone
MRMTTCPKCQGGGRDTFCGRECRRCEGTGEIPVEELSNVQCWYCRGTGNDQMWLALKCRICGGTGVLPCQKIIRKVRRSR